MSSDREAHPAIVRAWGSNAEVAWTVSKEWESENAFDALGSEAARQTLALASLKPLSVIELAEHCEVSEPTIYRWIYVL